MSAPCWPAMILIVHALVLGIWPGVVDARLAVSPLALSISPSIPRYGDTTTVRIELAHRPPAAAADARYDLYLVQVFANQFLARQEPYLTPAGSWSAAPVPVRRSVTLAEFTRAETPWVTAPAGWFPMALVVVLTGRAPADRGNWAFQPTVRWVRVRRPPDPHAPSTGKQVTVLGALALASLAIVVVVWVAPTRTRVRQS